MLVFATSDMPLSPESMKFDVRPEDEFAHGHLPGALNVPFAQLELRLAELPPNREVVALLPRALVRPLLRGGRTSATPGPLGAAARGWLSGMESSRPAG
jgi:hypothetical protein